MNSANLPHRSSGKPWLDLKNVPTEIYRPKGMLGPEERGMLYWATREDFTGQGQVVDAGAFLGASAYALARGIADRGDGKTPGPIWVHSYDYFSVVDDYVGAFIANQIRPVESGDSYLDLFRQQLGTLADRVRPYAGDMRTHDWEGSPIEILFIDIAKTKELNSHILRQFFPRLIPGRSIVIQQDFYHAWHPYIHVTMQVLKKYFEIIDPDCPYQSRVYRSVGAIPADELERAARYDYDPEQCYRLLAELAAEFGAAGSTDGAAAAVVPYGPQSRLGTLRHRMEDIRARKRSCLARPLGDGGQTGAWGNAVRHGVGTCRRRFACPVGTPGMDSADAAYAKALQEWIEWRSGPPSYEDRGPRAEAGRWPDFLVLAHKKPEQPGLRGCWTTIREVWLPPIKELSYFNQIYMPSADQWEPRGLYSSRSTR